MTSCSKPSDCFDNETKVQKFCYFNASFSSLPSVCECDLGLGWVGENCDQVSPILVFGRFFHFLTLTIAAILLIFMMRTTILSFMLKPGLQFFLDINTLLMFLVVLGLCLYLSYLSLESEIYLNPKVVEILVYKSFILEDQERLGARNEEFHNSFLIFSVICILFSNLFILLSLNEFIVKISRFSSVRTGYYSKLWKRVILLIAAVYFLLSMFLLAMNLQRDLVLFAPAYIIAMSICFPIIAWRFLKILKALKATETHYVEQYVKIIEKTVLAISVINILKSALYVFYILMQEPHLKYGKPGEIDAFTSIGDLHRFLNVVLLGVHAFYLNSISEGTILADLYPQLCCIFRYWDCGNKRVFPEDSMSDTNPMPFTTCYTSGVVLDKK